MEGVEGGLKLIDFLKKRRKILFRMERGFTYRSILLQYVHSLSEILYWNKVIMVVN